MDKEVDFLDRKKVVLYSYILSDTGIISTKIMT